MIDFYYAPTPNGHKITLFLEEAQLAYRLIRVDIGKGNSFIRSFSRSHPTTRSRRSLTTLPPTVVAH
jgi:GST-like protein